MSDKTAKAAAQRIADAADHYLTSVKQHGYGSATAEHALHCYTCAIEQDADVVARAYLALAERCDGGSR